ncbi:MAG: pyridoxal phosphate-dependent aminotransferase [Mobilitalea sp.]
MYYVNEKIKNIHRIKSKGSRINYLRLDTNENPQGLPIDFFNEVMKKVTPELLAMYPEKEAVLTLLAKHEQINEECISLTNGSDEAIRLAFETFGCAGSKLLTVTPTFEMYNVYSNMFGMIHEVVPYDDTFQVSVEDIIKRIDDNTKIVVLLNPNSPIGSTYKDSEIREIIQKAVKKNAIVIIDEAYHYFYDKTFIKLIHEYDNVLVTRTFSKLCSLAGVRIGYIAGNKELIHYIENAQSTYNINCIGLLFVEELLKRPDIIRELQEIERTGREYLIGELNKTDYPYFYQYGNYILVKSKLSPVAVADSLKSENILVKTYGSGILKDWLRITTGSVDVMERFWKAFITIDNR